MPVTLALSTIDLAARAVGVVGSGCMFGEPEPRIVISMQLDVQLQLTLLTVSNLLPLLSQAQPMPLPP